MAIFGCVNCIITPLNSIPLSKAEMISPTGKSHAFSKNADGYVRGEGCGIVILKKYNKVNVMIYYYFFIEHKLRQIFRTCK